MLFSSHETVTETIALVVTHYATSNVTLANTVEFCSVVVQYGQQGGRTAVSKLCQCHIIIELFENHSTHYVPQFQYVALRVFNFHLCYQDTLKRNMKFP